MIQVFDSAGRLKVVGAAAPSTSSYVVMSLDGTLTQERVLTGSASLLVTDGGANNPVTLSVIDNSSIQKVEIVKNSGAVIGTRKQLNFIEGVGITLTIADDGGNDQVDITIDAATAVGYTTIEDEGVAIVQRSTINFVGAGINAADVGAKSQITLDADLNTIAGLVVARGAIMTGSAAPAWQILSLGTAGKILRSDGTDLLYSTSTFANTYGASELLYSNGANTVQGLTTANYAILNTGATGIPSVTATPLISTSLEIGLAGTATGVLKLSGTTSGTVSVTTKAIAGTWTLTLPDNDGNANEFLQTDGAGVTSWAAQSTIASVVTIVDDTTTNAAMYPTWVTANAGNLPIKVSSTKISWNPSTALLTVTGGGITITTGVLSVSSAVDTIPITASNSLSLTGAAIISLTSTWNTASIANGILLNVTDTASDGDSSLINLKVATVTQFRVTKAGNIIGISGDLTSNLYLGVASITDGQLILRNATNAFTTTIKTGVTGASYTLTLPTTDGNASEILQTNGSGVLTWVAGTSLVHDILSLTHSDTLAAAVTRGAIIVGNSTPKWARVTVGASGTFVQSDGTDTAFSTVTLPLTTTINRILYSSAANVVGQIATAADAVLVTGGTGIPVMSADLPGTVTIGTAYIYRVGGNDVAIADGGTGQSTAILGFNALSPVTTRGDIIVRGATDNDRLALGAVGKILRSDGTDLVYTTATFPNTATTTGAYLRADGTNWITSTLILPNSSTVNRIVLSTATNTYGDAAGLTYTVSTGALTSQLSTNASVTLTNSNANAGAAAQSIISATNGTNFMTIRSYGTGFTTAGLLVANLNEVRGTGGAMLISATTAASTIAFAIGGTAATNETFRVDTNGGNFSQLLTSLTFSAATNKMLGQATLVLGTKAVTITGLTTSHRAFVQLVTIGGTIAAQYMAVCTANTLTITAETASGITQTLDTSTLNYVIFLNN